jgi:nucleoside-diphosphate-sugar epimerase
MDINTVAVFGASGKIGGRVLPLVRERDARVRALVHRTPIEMDGVETITGSIADPEAVREVVAGADVVVQMATTKEDPDTFFDVSVKGTFNVLEACRDEGVKQFIIFGGDASFGIWFYPQPIPIDESHKLMAYPGHYAFSKVMEEVMTEQYGIQYGVPWTVVRSSWVFDEDDLLGHFSLLDNVDPSEPGHGFGDQPPEIMELVEAGEERVVIQTNGEGVPYTRHIVHIDDLMQGFGLVLGNEVALGRSFNVAAPAAFNYRPAADYLSERTGAPTLELPCPGYHSFEIDINRARAMLGYAPENDVFMMADRALAWRAANSD